MKIQIVTIFVLLLQSNCDVSGFIQNRTAELLTNPHTNVLNKSTRFIEKAISVGSQLTNFLGEKFSSMSSKISNTLEQYYGARNDVIQAESSLMTGASLSLTELEAKVNDLFLRHKAAELNMGQNNTDMNAAGLHFFKAKSLIKKSRIFRFLQQMPKGAVLHLHHSASVSSSWVVRNISYMPGLLRCANRDGVSILSFRESKSHGCTTSYATVSKERAQSYSASVYDTYFEKLINLYTPNPETAYPSIDKVWTKFQNMFATLSDAIEYLDAFRLYYWQMLKEMYEDNIMYAEVRMGLYELYDKNGKTFSKEYTIRELLDIVKQFCQQHPKFMGIKLILSSHRSASNRDMKMKIDDFQKLQAKYPDFIIGYDLVGQEDKGKPLPSFIDQLLQSPRPAYFFHAGETNRFGTSTDFNLYDAILLNTKRIGHGYMLMKHPLLRKIVKRRQIAVEVCPLSNQVLHLTEDLRNHPAGNFLAENIPMVISNDDPGFWDATGLSFDFYYAIMSFASEKSGLEVLKTLVLNSLKYSAMNGDELNMALSYWQRDWTIFLNSVLHGNVF